MTRYYVNNNKQTNGDHEVHREDCEKLPSNRKDLGEFENCKDAVLEAKKTYPQSNGCKICSNECHTQ
ncbi:MAG: hypothetical protein QOJ98_1376 [Acidobacteriota bacterium]|jgi:hypothetical protein|nr:hypothetical protein [Acidobacteriota bacterium]